MTAIPGPHTFDEHAVGHSDRQPRIFGCRSEYEPCTFEAEPAVEIDDPTYGHLAVMRCTVCGHGLTVPEVDDVSTLYEGRQTQDYQILDSPLATIIKRFVFRRQTRTMLRQAHYSGGAIIDFGCGSGLYTDCIAAAAGTDAEVIGADFFPEPPAQIGAASYRSFAQLEAAPIKADLVTCFHVLEHENDPQDILKQLRQLAKPHATYVIEVPHIDCPWRFVFAKHWDNWYLPFHRTHFSRRSLRHAMAEAGLEIVAEHPIHIPCIGRSLANLSGNQNGLPFILAGAVTFPVQAGVEKLFDGPSALRIVARNVA